MKKTKIAMSAIVLFFGTHCVLAQSEALDGHGSAGATKVTNNDRTFFHRAAIAGKKEVAVSEIVMPSLRSEEVRQFARMMVSDHTAANLQLKMLAEKRGVTLPDGEKSVSGKWVGAKGADLDRRYMKEMVSDHKDSVALFLKAEGSRDTELAAFASEMRPKLEHHLAMAEDLAEKAK